LVSAQANKFLILLLKRNSFGAFFGAFFRKAIAASEPGPPA
jgi:hypothetical protein